MSDKFLIIILCFVLAAGALIALTTTSDGGTGDHKVFEIFMSNSSEDVTHTAARN